MSYQFDKHGGGEQDYGCLVNCPPEEMEQMISSAAKNDVNLVAVTDAENVVVMITTQRIAELMLPFLNGDTSPLDSLNFMDEK